MLITNIQYTIQIAVLSLNFFFLFIQFCYSLWQIAWLIKAPQALRNTPPLLGAPKVIL